MSLRLREHRTLERPKWLITPRSHCRLLGVGGGRSRPLRASGDDHFVWREDPRTRQAFDLAHQVLAPSIEVKELDVDDLSPETVGTFDVVLFCGVLYHLRHPLASLERVAKLVKECLVLETHLIKWPLVKPYMRFYPGRELSNDPTNWWGPNRACAEAMLRDVGQSDQVHAARLALAPRRVSRVAINRGRRLTFPSRQSRAPA